MHSCSRMTAIHCVCTQRFSVCTALWGSPQFVFSDGMRWSPVQADEFPRSIIIDWNIRLAHQQFTQFLIGSKWILRSSESEKASPSATIRETLAIHESWWKQTLTFCQVFVTRWDSKLTRCITCDQPDQADSSVWNFQLGGNRSSVISNL